MAYLLMLLLVGTLVVLHELGHLYVARWCGVSVKRFGLGLPIGAPFFSFRWASIQWCLHWLPLGGYVAFEDDEDQEESPKAIRPAAINTHRLDAKPWYQQLAVAVAGVTVNAIVAVLLLWGVLQWQGLPLSQVQVQGWLWQGPTGAHTVASSCPASAPSGGVRYRLGYALPSQGASSTLLYAALPTLQQQVASFNALEGAGASDTFHPHLPQLRLYCATATPSSSPLLQLAPSVGGQYGLSEGLWLVAVNDQPLGGVFQQPLQRLKEALQASKSRDIKLTVSSQPPNAQGQFEPHMLQVLQLPLPASGKLGVSLAPLTVGHQPAPWWATLQATFAFLSHVVVQNFTALAALLTGQVSLNAVDGPVGLISQGGALIEQNGISQGLILTAVLSAILAVMNLLPFPPLDGAHMVYCLYEGLRGKPFPLAWKDMLNQVGFVVLLALMVLVLGNDLWKLLVRLLSL
jgi:regulator of sigma E protease